MHTAEAAAAPAAAPTAAPAAPGTFWQFVRKCLAPSSLAPCSLFRTILGFLLSAIKVGSGLLILLLLLFHVLLLIFLLILHPPVLLFRIFLLEANDLIQKNDTGAWTPNNVFFLKSFEWQRYNHHHEIQVPRLRDLRLGT